jgi:twitching motility protein PilT
VSGYENQLEQIVAELNRAAPGARDSRPDAPLDPSSLDAVLAHAVRLGASDLLLIADVPVTLRVAGVLSHSTGPPLTAGSTRNLLLPLMTQTQNQELQRNKSVDLCFSREGIGRFRANVHCQRGTIAGTFRLPPCCIDTAV